MNTSDLGTVTAYGNAKEGGYTGTSEEWYNLLLAIISGEVEVPYDTMAERPLINGITVTGDRLITFYGIYDVGGGSYFRIYGEENDEIFIDGVSYGTVGEAPRQIGGFLEIKPYTVKVGDYETEIDVPYFGLYKVKA